PLFEIPEEHERPRLLGFEPLRTLFEPAPEGIELAFLAPEVTDEDDRLRHRSLLRSHTCLLGPRPSPGIVRLGRGWRAWLTGFQWHWTIGRLSRPTTWGTPGRPPRRPDTGIGSGRIGRQSQSGHRAPDRPRFGRSICRLGWPLVELGRLCARCDEPAARRYLQCQQA